MVAKFSGHKIRVMRKDLNMSIKDLAEKADLSTGLISQIERDLVSPSVNAMTRIVDALGTTMGEFFDADYVKENPLHLKKNEHKIVSMEDWDRTYEIVSPTDNRDIELVFMRFSPTSDPDAVKVRVHEGEECGYVIQGSLTVEVEDKQYVLESGDSIYFESTAPHRYINYSDKECVSIWAMSPPSY
ncbi:MAG: cupin domain-containing protein [Tissierellia bacterium]|nr:cupin domain-containing protein [Tissierellia bacterium]